MTERHLFVIFGATGDLTARKLLPALYHLVGERPDTVVLGAAGSDLDDERFRERARRSLAAAGHTDASRWCDERVHYQRIGRDGRLEGLAARIADIERQHGLPGHRVFYLAMPPGAFPATIEGLGGAGLNTGPGWTRLVIEKPFGHDLDSARALNDAVHTHFDESQVYRIDHYLGKETVRNLLVFRFANPLFEGSWNRDRIERVEITVAEALDVGARGRYYDHAGAVRDMVQSHLMQVLCLIAMEAPTSMDADAVRAEKVKVLHAIRNIDPGDVVLGQYEAANDGSNAAYRTLDGVEPDSTTPTYAAVRLLVDTWRWQGVPFYLRTGKAMARRITEIVVTFRPPPVCLFHGQPDTCMDHGDVLRLTLQPDEGFSLEIEVKEPGDQRGVRTIPLRFEYAEQFGPIPDAYETLLRDVIEGDQTLFVRGDWVEESWRLFTPLVTSRLPVLPYPAGTWGPVEAARLLGPDADGWATTG
jgi:glucose-6-phosphate 1-dehydrogenase